MPILGDKLKVKKLFSRGTLKEKEIKLGPHSGSPKGWSSPGDKKILKYLYFGENLKIWLEILNKKILKYLNFAENLKIWLEILNKKKLKFWLQTTTWNRLLLEPFLKNPYPHKEFDFQGGNSPTCREY